MLSWPILLCSLLNLSSKLCSLLRREKFNIYQITQNKQWKNITSKNKDRGNVNATFSSGYITNIMYKYYREKSFNKIIQIYFMFLHGILTSHLLFMKKGEKLSPILPFPSLQQWTTLHSGSVARRLFSLSKKTQTP